MITTISGKLVGLSDNVVVRYNEDEKRIVETVKLRGRWLYVRKCSWEEKFDGIYICEISQRDLPIALVLGIGNECGKHHKLTKEEKRKGMTEQVEWPLDVVGKKVLSPDNHEWGILNMPWNDGEFMIHESIVKAILD